MANTCHGKGSWDEIAWVGLPLACLSLFPMADVDKVSND